MILFAARYPGAVKALCKQQNDFNFLVSPKVHLGDKIVLYWSDLGSEAGKRSVVNRK